MTALETRGGLRAYLVYWVTTLPALASFGGLGRGGGLLRVWRL
ncbi:hypothetical protein [Streptomyces sp. DHE17-7]|nr:hypothetical protein [Streptomyces sp. DHE17-7]